MPRYDGPAPGSTTGKAGIAFAEERRPDTTLIALRLATSRRLQRQRLVERIWGLGPRIVFELLEEIARCHGLDADLDRRLELYASLDPAALHAVGGHRSPPAPLHLVPQ